MDKVVVFDNNQQLKFLCEDLQAVHEVANMAEDQSVYFDDHDVLTVVKRALEPIISDLQKIINSINQATIESPNYSNQETKELEKVKTEL